MELVSSRPVVFQSQIHQRLPGMGCPKRKAPPPIPRKLKKACKYLVDEQVYDCIIVQMLSPHSRGHRLPLATLPPSSTNSGHIAKLLNTSKSCRSTEVKLKPATTLISDNKVETLKSTNRRLISPRIGELSASAEKEVYLVTSHGEDLIGRRRSRRIAGGQKVNYIYMDISLESPLPKEDSQPEQLTDPTTPRSSRSSTVANCTNSSWSSTSKPTRRIQPKRDTQKPEDVIQEIQSVDSSEPSIPRGRILRSSTYSPTGSNSSPSRTTSPTSTPKRKRRTTPLPKTPEARLPDKYPFYLDQLLRDRVYDKEVTVEKEAQVFEEEIKERGWNVGGKALSRQDK